MKKPPEVKPDLSASRSFSYSSSFSFSLKKTGAVEKENEDEYEDEKEKTPPYPRSVRLIGRQISAFVSGAVLSTGLLSADNDLEQLAGYPLERYHMVLEKSPFAKEAVLEASPTGPLFGQDLVLTGHFALGDVLYAVILNKKTQERLTASSDETRPDRPRVLSFAIDPDPGKSTAVIQLGQEKASIRFETIQAPKEAQKTAANPSPQTVAAPTPAANRAAAAGSPAPAPQRPLQRMRYKKTEPQTNRP
jgi:hypothetical protein